jgi:RNA polymerase sigma factor (TIGR02999 family)
MAAQGDGRMRAEVETLFHELADLSPEARAQYFAEHHVDDDIRREVAALLAFDSGASSFLLRDVGIAAGRALQKLERAGWRGRPYRLLDVIGRGGMGAVYLAERTDGEVTERLAVKLLPLGASDALRKRFLLEGRTLAALTHPNIARLLDVGHLDSGQPFIVMEFIDGQPIDEFASGLGVRQKIELFLKVCAAVRYLHRNLVVHRDLKPSNVLVTADGEPKLLDFGIARFLDLAADPTTTSMRMLTPGYASPEQVTGSKPSTATDIYSLGAMLYRCLTGKAPHELPCPWVPELKGDLEFILLKAMRKDSRERYTTVDHLAKDLQAFLDSEHKKDQSVLDALMSALYSDLHRVAEGHIRSESSDHTLQTSPLLHEAYLKLSDDAQRRFSNKTHFLAAASRVMRQVLVDHARARAAKKRGGGESLNVASSEGKDLHAILKLDRALDVLAQEDEALAQLIQMRYFGGMTAKETAEVLGCSVHVVRNDLRLAQAWLRRERRR